MSGREGDTDLMKLSLKLKSPPLWWLVWSWEGGEFVAATLQEPDSLF